MTEVSRTTHEAITALVDDLAQHMERQNLTMGDRERAACLTLLAGLHATGQLRLTAPARAADGSLAAYDYDYETATEPERYAYDCGREDAHNPGNMGLEEILDVMDAVSAALQRMIAEAEQAAGQ